MMMAPKKAESRQTELKLATVATPTKRHQTVRMHFLYALHSLPFLFHVFVVVVSFVGVK